MADITWSMGYDVWTLVFATCYLLYGISPAALCRYERKCALVAFLVKASLLICSALHLVYTHVYFAVPTIIVKLVHMCFTYTCTINCRLAVCVRNNLGRPMFQSDSFLTHAVGTAVSFIYLSI